MRIGKMLLSNQRLEDLEEETDTIFSGLADNEVCHICRKGFTIMTKKYSCGVCKMPICLSDSTFFSENSRICDSCRHEIIVEEIWKGKKETKDKIIHNMQRIMLETSKKQEKIKSETENFEALKKKLENLRKNAEVEEKQLNESIDQLIKINNSTEKNIDKIIQDGKKKKVLGSYTVDKIAKAQEQIQIAKIELEEAIQENKNLNSKLDPLRENRETLDLNKIKSKLCRICLLRIRPAKNLEIRKIEMSDKVCNCISF